MSPPRSDTTGTTIDPLRPADHADHEAPAVTQPAIGIVGWLRWMWRQLTSMRTALILLLLMAVAAIPGSLFPQRSADPNGVIQWQRDNPEAFPIADAAGMFDVYASPWFSAIYLLLFTSLIGCVIPRAKHHYKALRSRPPRTPVRLSRLADYEERVLPAGPDAQGAAERAVESAERQLRRSGYRVQRYDGPGWVSVSAERGYLRETGNLLFHIALIGVLIAVGLGGAISYTGQRVIVEGTTFVNTLNAYSSFEPGRFVDGTELAPYSLSLDKFQVTYRPPGTPGEGQAVDFSADLTLRIPGQEDRIDSVRVNHPIEVAGDRILLLGNGYAPTLTVRDQAGEVIYRDALPFLPQDWNMTSLGIIKIPDGLPEQLGLVGFFYPTQGQLPSGAFTSIFPEVINPVITLNVFSGDLGIDDGTPRSVYRLEVEGLTQHTGGDTGVESLQLTPGATADLPNDWGSVTWEVESAENPVKRFASLQIQRDPTAVWVLVFSILALSGLFAGLFVPRRRFWVKARTTEEGLRVEYAGLARGDDPTLARAVTAFATQHSDDTPPRDGTPQDSDDEQLGT